jgi:hypothetical protein
MPRPAARRDACAFSGWAALPLLEGLPRAQARGDS